MPAGSSLMQDNSSISSIAGVRAAATGVRLVEEGALGGNWALTGRTPNVWPEFGVGGDDGDAEKAMTMVEG